MEVEKTKKVEAPKTKKNGSSNGGADPTTTKIKKV